ncbi:PREDICTED: TNF receptor-associated factor 4-like [Priapulus caudatus]|uniref:TNF receptor-associated factor 4-like n=1 Tax=Priapulus caudatus TaxID=37621 RepID=A0ABM1DR60_PRICU|nr:PREDICTED: TNF receptor-associated factor 4-like [Priapulus caudatus]
MADRTCRLVIYADPDTEATVMSMKIRCIHSKAGCKWSDQLKQLQSHLVTCRYDAVPCTNNCPAMLAKIALDDHLTYTCPRRKETCEFCSREFTGEMLEGHLGSCQFEPVFCEEKCGATLQRRFLSNHLLNECSKRRVACKYCSREFVYETLTVSTHKNNH